MRLDALEAKHMMTHAAGAKKKGRKKKIIWKTKQKKERGGDKEEFPLDWIDSKF